MSKRVGWLIETKVELKRQAIWAIMQLISISNTALSVGEEG